MLGVGVCATSPRRRRPAVTARERARGGERQTRERATAHASIERAAAWTRYMGVLVIDDGGAEGAGV